MKFTENSSVLFKSFLSPFIHSPIFPDVSATAHCLKKRGSNPRPDPANDLPKTPHSLPVAFFFGSELCLSNQERARRKH